MKIETAKSIAKDIPVMYHPVTTGLIHGETIDFIGMVTATEEELQYFHKPLNIDGEDYLVPSAYISQLEDYHSWFSKKASKIICSLSFNYHSDYSTIHDALMSETTKFAVEIDRDWKILRHYDDYDINYRLAPTIGLDDEKHIALKWALRRSSSSRDKTDKKNALRAVIYPSITEALTDLFENEGYQIPDQSKSRFPNSNPKKGKVIVESVPLDDDDDDDDDDDNYD